MTTEELIKRWAADKVGIEYTPDIVVVFDGDEGYAYSSYTYEGSHLTMSVSTPDGKYEWREFSIGDFGEVMASIIAFEVSA